LRRAKQKKVISEQKGRSVKVKKKESNQYFRKSNSERVIGNQGKVAGGKKPMTSNRKKSKVQEAKERQGQGRRKPRLGAEALRRSDTVL